MNDQPPLRIPEILAPAGDDECLTAALNAGADAVYFGLAEGFNARARATNFTLDSLPGTVERIHRHGARAYVTMNTLVFDSELGAVEAILRRLAGAGIDAILVQDPAVARLATEVGVPFERHASTQMTLSSPEGMSLARDLGLSRVVLPRELTLEEIALLRRSTDLELEVFVHGALCMSWSGQCLTSEAWGGRSANRGQCAQSCRLPYDLVVDGVTRDLGSVAHLLSPHDLAAWRVIPRLIELGIASLKIEGRQKGPAYVTTAVEAYRAARDRVVARARPDEELLPREAIDAMAVSFSRGFSTGFFEGVNHQQLVDGTSPTHRGLRVGIVDRVEGHEVILQPESDRPGLKPGDGVVFAADREGGTETGGPLFAVAVRADG
ncbi:MAG TPA: peptidase U32 family protein, partial [Candidatus Eisenbacteria bacterium]